MRTLTGFTIVACCLVLMPDFAWSADKHRAAAAKFSRIPKAGSIFHDCPDCPDMVAIPEGSFDMGSPNSENSRNDDEGPVHRVKLTAFAMGKTEITRGQFSAFVIKSKYITGDKCVALKGSRFEEHRGGTGAILAFCKPRITLPHVSAGTTPKPIQNGCHTRQENITDYRQKPNGNMPPVEIPSLHVTGATIRMKRADMRMSPT